MACQLAYTPPTPPDSRAREELDDLVAALHDAELLRALAGGARSYPDILRLLLRSVAAETLRSLVALSSAATDLDPSGAERVARGRHPRRRHHRPGHRGELRGRRSRHPRTTVAEYVTGKPVTIGADDDVAEALRTMVDDDVRRLPVIDGHDLVGMLSQADVAQPSPPQQVGELVGAISEPN